MSTVNEQGVADLLSMLFGSEVPIKKLDTSLPQEDHFMVGTYQNGEGKIEKLIYCDCGFTNRAGAALTMIPPHSVQALVDSSQTEENILANLHEILNIGVNMLDTSSASELALGEVTEVASLESSFEVKSADSFEVEIARYGSGVITIASVV